MERLQEVKEEVAEEAKIRKKMEDELKKMLEDIKLLKEFVSFANIVAENSAAGGGSVTDSSVSVADSVADNSAAGLGSIYGSNSTGVGSVSGNVTESSPSAAGSSRISNSVAFSGAGKCSATSVVSNL
ncbi:hypothetical protein HID58_048024 [Brassica napus]|uniref:RAB6-interacting golgin n=1 Tax=Brassica napus TaxID=3708 RepID=A0ABQ8B0W2_BRANA|nr:hypothetical protein HID58_048024 [Brassica napus]